MSEYVPDLKDYMSGIGAGVKDNAAPLTMLAQMFSNYGRSTTAAPQQNLDLLIKGLSGQQGQKVLQPQAPVATAPQPGAATVPPPVAAPAPAAPSTTPARKPSILWPDAITGKLAPMMAGEDTLPGQVAPVKQDPSIGSTDAGVVLPAMQVPAVAPSVQNLNTVQASPTDIFNASWMLPGGGTDALKLVQESIANNLNSRKIGAEEATAQASNTSANAKLMDSIREIAMHPEKVAAERALTRERISTAEKNDAARDPEAAKRIAAATAQGTEIGKAQAEVEYARTPAGALSLDPQFTKDMGLPGIKTSGDLMLLVGRDNYYKMLDSWNAGKATKEAAKTTAEGAVKAAESADKFSTLLLKGLEDGVASSNKVIEQLDKTTIDLTNVPPEQRMLKMMQNPKATERTPEQKAYYNAAVFRRDQGNAMHAQLLQSLTHGKTATIPTIAPPPAAPSAIVPPAGYVPDPSRPGFFINPKAEKSKRYWKP